MKSIIVTIIILVSNLSIQGQLGNLTKKLGKEIKNEVKKEVKSEVEKEKQKLKNKANDKIRKEKNKIKKRLKKQLFNSTKKLIIGAAFRDASDEYLWNVSEKVPPPPKFEFDTVVEGKYKDNDGNTIKSKLYFGRAPNIMGYSEVGKDVIIVANSYKDLIYNFHIKDKKMHNLSGAILTGSVTASSITAHRPTPKVERTGKTKVIAGYTCDEILIYDNKYFSSVVYVIPEMRYDFTKLTNKTFFRMSPMDNSRASGLVMSDEYDDYETKLKSTYKVSKVSKQNTVIHTRYYEHIRLGKKPKK